MGDESTDVVRLGVTFIMLAAVMVFVVFNIIWGEDMSRDFNARMDSTRQVAMNRYFKQACEKDGVDLPVAGAYSLIEDNEDDVEAVAIGYEDKNSSKEKTTGWFAAPNYSTWRFYYRSGTQVPTNAPGMLKDSVVHYRRYKWVMLFDGTEKEKAELWLRNNMNGRCNVKAAKTSTGTYCLVINLYRD